MSGTAFSASNWTGYDEQSVTNPGSALTDFTLLIDVSTLSSTWKSNVQSDGADIRLTKGDNTELAYDLIDWAYNSGAPTGFIRGTWAGTLAASGTQNVRVWAGYTGGTAVAYGVSETYGQYNAYGPHVYFSLDGAENRVDGTTPTDYSGVSHGDTSAQVGNGTSLDGTAQYWSTGVTPPTGDATVYCWGSDADDGSESVAVYASPRYKAALRTYGFTGSGYLGLTVFGSADYKSTMHTPTSLEFCGWSITSGSDVQYRLGSNTDSDSIGSYSSPTGLLMGAQSSGVGNLDGVLNYIGVLDGALGDDWLAEEYAQSNDQSSFWGTWAWTTYSSGFTGTVTADINAIAAALAGKADFIGSGSADVNAIAAALAGAADFIATGSGDVNAIAAALAGTFTASGFTGTATADINAIAAALAGKADFIGSGAVDINALAASLAGTFTAAGGTFTGTAIADVNAIAAAVAGKADFIALATGAITAIAAALEGTTPKQGGGWSATMRARRQKELERRLQELQESDEEFLALYMALMRRH